MKHQDNKTVSWDIPFWTKWRVWSSYHVPYSSICPALFLGLPFASGLLPEPTAWMETVAVSVPSRVQLPWVLSWFLLRFWFTEMLSWGQPSVFKNLSIITMYLGHGAYVKVQLSATLSRCLTVFSQWKILIFLIL